MCVHEKEFLLHESSLLKNTLEDNHRHRVRITIKRPIYNLNKVVSALHEFRGNATK